MNPDKPVSPTIVEHHDRTVAQVVAAFGLTLTEPSPDDELLLLNGSVMNHALSKHAAHRGVRSLLWRVA